MTIENIFKQMICYCFCVMPMSSMSGSEHNKIFSQMIYSLLPHLILIEHSGILSILKEDKEKFNFDPIWPRNRPVEYPRGLIFISTVKKCASNNFTVSWDFSKMANQFIIKAWRCSPLGRSQIALESILGFIRMFSPEDFSKMNRQ